MRNLLFDALPWAALMFFTVAASGQELVGSRMFGTVTDPTGRSVPQATVTIMAPETGFSRTIKTAEDGTFLAPQIIAGTYDIEVSSPGFKTARVTGILVRVNENARQDVRLEVGDVATKVE